MQVQVVSAHGVHGGPAPPPLGVTAYGAVPPVTLKLIVPSLPPLHWTLVGVVTTARAAGAALMVTLVGTGPQLLASVTLKVYAPAAKPVNTYVHETPVPQSGAGTVTPVGGLTT